MHTRLPGGLVAWSLLVDCLSRAAKGLGHVLELGQPVLDRHDAALIEEVHLGLEGLLRDLQAFYFSVTTMTTVGYGDFSPKTLGSRLFTTVYIAAGVMVIFAFLGQVFDDWSEWGEAGVKSLLGRIFFPWIRCFRACGWLAPAKERLEDEEVGLAELPPAWRFYLAKLGFTLLVGFLFNFVFSPYIFTVVQPELGYGDAVWHCWTTSSTVGYGDISLSNEISRGWGAVHILISVAWLVRVGNLVGGSRKTREFQLERKAQYERQLDPNLIEKLDRGGEGQVDEVEFVAGMLVQMNAELCGQLLDWDKDVQPLRTKFKALDNDDSGTLELADLKFMLQQAHKKLKGVDRDAEYHRASEWERDEPQDEPSEEGLEEGAPAGQPADGQPVRSEPALDGSLGVMRAARNLAVQRERNLRRASVGERPACLSAVVASAATGPTDDTAGGAGGAAQIPLRLPREARDAEAAREAHEAEARAREVSEEFERYKRQAEEEARALRAAASKAEAELLHELGRATDAQTALLQELRRTKEALEANAAAHAQECEALRRQIQEGEVRAVEAALAVTRAREGGVALFRL